MSVSNREQAGSGFNKKTVKDIDVGNKRVLVRVDYNVPVDKNNEISDDSRIRASLPTIQYLLDRQARVILCSHFGRPKGKVVETMRLAPEAKRLSELLGKPVFALKDCISPEVEAAVNQMKSGDIILLENLRFHPGEEANDPAFAGSLARLADIFVDDAFGSSHRAHASVTGVAQKIPAVAGFLMEKELINLGKLLSSPAHPFIAVMGGAKVSDKMGVIRNILDKVDALLIGGGMAANFLRARGLAVGASAVEEDRLDYVREMLALADTRNVRIVLPSDVIIAEKLEAGAPVKAVRVEEIPTGWIIADIGPQAAAAFAGEIKKSRTIFWNGPMGVFEIETMAAGTRGVAEAMAENSGTTVVGGGSTAESVEDMGLAAKMTHVSTGGGASLEFLEGLELPGVAVLQDK
ncbi:MAG: phosphoglycerate kinase [Dehalococcoidales bacterium]|nr:phosphoglycerate kinase [Dehalococcoidales bacterium]